jgi:2-keto-3-deoxy-L-rhamnonate aldolase RhmA
MLDGWPVVLLGFVMQADASTANPIDALLASGKPVFGIFSEKTKESAEALSKNELVDFVFYDMEEGPFDVDGMKLFMQSLRRRPIVARLPPIRDGAEDAAKRAKLLVEAGVQGVVFPHVENREQSEIAVRSMPPKGAEAPVGILIIEDRIGVENASKIVSTPGVGIVFPGPGDLRRAYDGDAAAIERAIQTVLAACKENRVVCGITAGPHDIEKRLQEGFRVIIVTRPEALAIGRRAANR